ncbi:SIMPL domain-containing protein [Bartonella sp. B30(2025)]
MKKTLFQSLNGYPIITMVAFTLLATPLTAHAEDSKPKNSTITVTAIGESQTTPDIAIINLAVVTEHKTAQKALTTNNKAINNIIDALKNSGIQANDLQTSGLSIYQSVQDKYNNEKKENEKLYHVSNSLTVRIRDLSKIGKIFDQAMALGVNSVSGIHFINGDTKPFYQEARKKAVSEAIEKAETIAQTAHLKLGKIIKISENNDNYLPTPRLTRMSADTNDTNTNFSSGELSYHVGITVTFAVE